MEINHLFHLLLLITLTMLTSTTNSQPITPSPSPSPPSTTLEQLNNIIDALIGASDFTTWVSILSSMSNPTMQLPISATLFIPQDNTFSSSSNNNNNNNHPPTDPFLFPYHIIPQRLTFSDLLLLPPATRLPTLLPDRSISVTLNSAGNLSLDDIPVTHPDLYATPSVAVHGVANLLDYSLFGRGIPSPPPLSTPIGETIGWNKSGAGDGPSFWCTRGVNAVLFIICCCFLLQQLIAL